MTIFICDCVRVRCTDSVRNNERLYCGEEKKLFHGIYTENGFGDSAWSLMETEFANFLFLSIFIPRY